MIELKPEEHDLTGKWQLVDGQVVADATTLRIEALVEHQLDKLSTDSSGWDTLFRDPQDGRFWELTFPDSSLHGGGPPRLTQLSEQDARSKYNVAGEK